MEKLKIDQSFMNRLDKQLRISKAFAGDGILHLENFEITDGKLDGIHKVLQLHSNRGHADVYGINDLGNYEAIVLDGIGSMEVNYRNPLFIRYIPMTVRTIGGGNRLNRLPDGRQAAYWVHGNSWIVASDVRIITDIQVHKEYNIEIHANTLMTQADNLLGGREVYADVMLYLGALGTSLYGEMRYEKKTNRKIFRTIGTNREILSQALYNYLRETDIEIIYKIKRLEMLCLAWVDNDIYVGESYEGVWYKLPVEKWE